jgi:hypothetical protein
MIYDEQGRPVDWVYLAVNEAFERITGLKDAVGRKVTELIPGIVGAAPHLFEVYGRVASTGKSEDFEIDFTPLSLWLYVAVYSPSEGNFVAIFNDITERKKAEAALQAERDSLESRVAERTQQLSEAVEALRSSEQRYALAQRAAEIGSWDWNILTGELQWSDQIEPMFGFGPGQFGATYEAFLQCVHPDDRDFVIGSVNACLERDWTYDIEHRIIWPDGMIHWVLEKGDVIRDDTDRPIRMLGVVQDITRRKYLEEALRARTDALEIANRELEAFSYSVSHDLRAPLRVMDGFSLALLEDYSGALDEQARDYLGRIRAASLNMGVLIDDLLSLSRVTRAEMHPARVDLSALARNLTRTQCEAAPGRDVEVVIAEGLAAECDPQLLKILLQNLLANAWKFTTKKAAARIEFGKTSVDGAEAFYVRDDGAGFDSKYADKLFIPFQRLHSAAEFEGSGIGLAIVQRIVNRHGGRVWAEGEPGRGATFYFTLKVR